MPKKTNVSQPTQSSGKKSASAPVQTQKSAPAPVAPVQSTPVKKGKQVSKPANKQVGGEVQQNAPVKKSDPRYFKCIYRTSEGDVRCAGRYSGKKPKQAACKALTAIIKSYDGGCDFPIKFLITECTRGSRKKVYSYAGHQEDLEHPVEVKITKKDGTTNTITYKRTNVLKKVAMTECEDLVNADVPDDEEEVQQMGGKKAKKPAKKPAKKQAKQVKQAPKQAPAVDVKVKSKQSASKGKKAKTSKTSKPSKKTN